MPFDEDRVYVGIPSPDGPLASGARVMVESRSGACRNLVLPAGKREFTWGWIAASTTCTASAVLTDAVQVRDEPLPASEETRTPVWSALSVDFAVRFLLPLPPGEAWRLERREIIAWMRAWYQRKGISDLPEGLAPLPRP
ncbi:hypothetical protein ACFQLX_12860 [Streptomyces polyrhachis]|uniref:Uncharacterized protein n=1 Tax=Streptomyces polyrhachis TaxID=1282885 RepID=A0ABW2GHN8_9ACTN